MLTQIFVNNYKKHLNFLRISKTHFMMLKLRNYSDGVKLIIQQVNTGLYFITIKADA